VYVYVCVCVCVLPPPPAAPPSALPALRGLCTAAPPGPGLGLMKLTPLECSAQELHVHTMERRWCTHIQAEVIATGSWPVPNFTHTHTHTHTDTHTQAHRHTRTHTTLHLCALKAEKRGL